MDDALAARDIEVQEALKESKEGFERKLERVRAEQDMLKYERRNEARRMRDEIDQLKTEREAKYERQLVRPPLSRFAS